MERRGEVRKASSSARLSRRAVLQAGAAASGLWAMSCAPAAAWKAPNMKEEDETMRRASAVHGSYRAEKVRFTSEGVELVGNLYIPNDLSRPAPLVTLLGPYCYVKEQSPIQYATRLADEGFVALAFDCRHHGESGGAPRRYENPRFKIADARAAITFLASRPEVDRERAGVVGICEGSSEMLHVAAEDPRVKVIATVSGHYRDHANDVDLAGGEELLEGKVSRAAIEERLAKRLERGKEAKAKFEKTGEVDYLPIVDPARKDVALPWKMIWDWYHGWADRGLWENRYAVMSDPEYLAFESQSAAARLKKPLLMIHADRCDGPESARRHFESVPGKDKKLLWEGENNHFQYYEDPAVIDHAVGNIARWFRQHLG